MFSYRSFSIGRNLIGIYPGCITSMKTQMFLSILVLSLNACGNGIGIPAPPEGSGGSGGQIPTLVCTAPKADCDQNPTNGCETDVSSDVLHCGACDRVCPNLPGTNTACFAGDCQISCETGFTDCNQNPADGCEYDKKNLLTDRNNCGVCGVSCAVGVPCSEGSCGVCVPGTQQCSGASTQTCDETGHWGNPVACSPTLPGALADCRAGVCISGKCDSTHLNCDGDPSNGCEVDTTSDSQNCGSCENKCDPGSVCSSGTCVSN